MTPISKAYVFAQVNGDALPVGVIQKSEERAEYIFGYAQSWLARSSAYAIDPIHLPLSDKQYASERMFDCLLDSGPDNWGKRVMTATHRQVPRNPIEELIACRGSGAGNLLFSASRNRTLDPLPTPTFDDLEGLITGAMTIERRETVDDERLAKLLDYGSSMGGARPKVVISYKGEEWIAKLNRSDDTFDNAKAEWTCFKIAQKIGIRTPKIEFHRVGGKSVLLVSRFDRDDVGSRLHYISAQALLGIHRVREGDFKKGYSYAGVAEQIRKVSSDPWNDLRELYIRMVFNVCIHNTDDHLRNHGFVLEPNDPDEGYRLSPVFDIVPHEGSSLHAIGIGKDGRKGSLDNAKSYAKYFGLRPQEAEGTVRNVLSEVKKFHLWAREVDMGDQDVRRIRGILLSILE